MSRRNYMLFLLALVLAVALTFLAVKSLQEWQRGHFDCMGELSVQYPSVEGNIAIRYIFNGINGVAILRGEISQKGQATVPVNHNVWFSFTRKGQDYFLQSERVSASTGEPTTNALLSRTLPDFYLRDGVPFYLNISRTDGNHWLFFTSRSPSIYCKA